MELAGSRPRVSLQICDFLKSYDTAEKVLEMMLSIERDLGNKIIYLAQRINLWMRMGKRTKARELHKLLMSYVTSAHPLYQKLNSLEAVKIYA